MARKSENEMASNLPAFPSNLTTGISQITSANDSTKPIFLGGLQQIPPTSIVGLVITSTGLLTNGILLFLFLKDRSLRTPFNIYLMNLVLANTLSVLFVFPLSVVEMLYPVWILNDGACIFRQYGKCVIQAASFNGHQLIAINRIWSVCHPHSYRLAHFRTRGPVLVCLAMWLLIHLTSFPWVLVAVYSRVLPAYGRRCFFAPLGTNATDVAIELVVFVLPIVTMLIAFPVIFVARRIKRRNAVMEKTRVSSGHLGGSKNQTATEELGPPVDAPKIGGIVPKPQEVIKFSQKNCAEGTTERSKRSRDNFLTLGLLTISVAICWAPTNTVYVVGMFVKIADPVLYQIVAILYSLQPTIDPILFVIAMKNVRDSLGRLFRLVPVT